jgi:type I restriction enzyme M protein
LFYNTGISTYVWILRNNKPNKRKGKVQLINAVDFWKPMKRSLGDKRRYIDEEGIKKIVKIHKSFQKSEFSKIYDLDDFAYRKVTIELEELDENGNPLYETKDIKLSASKLSELCEISEKDLAQLKDKTKPNPKKLTVSLKKTGELVTKFQAKEQEIIIQKSIEGNKLVLTTQIQVPVKTKDTEVIPWKEDWKKWLDREVEKKWTFVEEKKGYEIPFTKEFYVYQPLRELETVLQEFATKEKENLSILKELGMKL